MASKHRSAIAERIRLYAWSGSKGTGARWRVSIGDNHTAIYVKQVEGRDGKFNNEKTTSYKLAISDEYLSLPNFKITRVWFDDSSVAWINEATHSDIQTNSVYIAGWTPWFIPVGDAAQELTIDVKFEFTYDETNEDGTPTPDLGDEIDMDWRSILDRMGITMPIALTFVGLIILMFVMRIK
jgi:hypothetical protein